MITPSTEVNVVVDFLSLKNGDNGSMNALISSSSSDGWVERGETANVRTVYA